MNDQTIDVPTTNELKSGELTLWAAVARPGSMRVYHHGHLMRQRSTDAELDAVAGEALRLWTNGKAVLVQRLRDDGGYDYRIVAGSFRIPPKRL